MTDAKETEKGSPKLNLDGKEYDLATLPAKAQVAVQFLQRVERELANLRYEVDKCALARAKAVEDLKKLVAEDRNGGKTELPSDSIQ